MGAIGIALNGVQFYGGAVERTDDDDPGCELLDRGRRDDACPQGVGYGQVRLEATAYWYAQNGDDAMAPLCASEPTAAPTTATWAPTTEAHLKICARRRRASGTCEAAGGVCYTAEAHCVGDGGAFLANRCGADCGCCVKQPSPARAGPRRAVASADHGRAVDRPGVPARRGRAGVALRGPRRRVLRVEPHVRGGRGGVFLANLCGDGAADADEPCGCCVRMPSAAPTWARAAASAALADDEDPGTAGFNSLYVILVLTFMSLVIFSLAAVGKFQYDKLKALEHKTERHRMSTRTRTEMVAAPAVV
ncbi:hypothetical protein JL720_17194 [Aureococcus anophagefferens]|nr:hypothetical protein JL720_17194 [Aureococcus anophagefferens]